MSIDAPTKHDSERPGHGHDAAMRPLRISSWVPVAWASLTPGWGLYLVLSSGDAMFMGFFWAAVIVVVPLTLISIRYHRVGGFVSLGPLGLLLVLGPLSGGFEGLFGALLMSLFPLTGIGSLPYIALLFIVSAPTERRRRRAQTAVLLLFTAVPAVVMFLVWRPYLADYL